MKILYTAFNGQDNSSKILLDKMSVDNVNKLYLRNSFETSVKQLIDKLKLKKYELVISFGQAPLEKDIIKIENLGKKDNNFYKTDFNYSKIKENNINCKMIFIHIPKIENISNIDLLAKVF